MRRWWGLLVAMLCFVAGPVLGQQGSGAAPATRTEILKLFEVMKVRQQVQEAMQQVIQQTKIMTHEALKSRHPDISAEEFARMDAMSEQTMKDFPVDGMLDDMIPVYQKHLTKSDVQALIGFYSTPTGQKMLRELPAITAEGMRAVYPRIQKQMDETMRKVEQMEDEERQKKQPAAPPPASPKS